jgi:hypothetical protein
LRFLKPSYQEQKICVVDVECGILLHYLIRKFMSVDVEIYLSQLFKFFNDNPNDLQTLIPKNQKEEFFKRCREVVMDNLEKGEELSLTRKQLIDICVEINRSLEKKPVEEADFKAKGIFQKAPIGLICLN